MLNKLGISLLIVIILIHGLVLTKLIYFPYPELFVYPYLTNHGLKPYNQILDQHFPGPLFLPINFDNLGMNTPQVARLWSIGIITVIHIMLFLIGLEIFRSKKKALLVNTLFLIWNPFFEGWVLWIDSFLPLFLLPAYYCLLKKKFFVSGVLIGLSIVFKQVLIPLSVFIAIYLFWRERKFNTVAVFLLGLFVPLVLMIIYFAVIGVLKDFWFWTIVFNLTAYAQTGRGIRPTTAHLVRVFFVFGSAFFLLALNKFKTKETQLLAIFLVGTLLGLATRFDFVHFQPALPFALIATVYGLGMLRGSKEFMVKILYGLVMIWWIIIFYKGHLGNRIISFDFETIELSNKIKSLTKPAEKIFVFGAAPHLYQMTNTLPAGNLFAMQVPWFLEFAESRFLEGIKRDNPEIIVVDRVTEFEGQKISDFAKDIDQYVNQNYQKEDSVGTVEILRRKTI